MTGLPELSPEFDACVLELIEWTDSQTTFTGWTYVREMADELPIRGRMLSVGWVLRENDEAVLIAPNLGGYDGSTSPQVCSVMTIPKVAIVSRQPLQVGRGRGK